MKKIESLILYFVSSLSIDCFCKFSENDLKYKVHQNNNLNYNKRIVQSPFNNNNMERMSTNETVHTEDLTIHTEDESRNIPIHIKILGDGFEYHKNKKTFYKNLKKRNILERLILDCIEHLYYLDNNSILDDNNNFEFHYNINIIVNYDNNRELLIRLNVIKDAFLRKNINLKFSIDDSNEQMCFSINKENICKEEIHKQTKNKSNYKNIMDKINNICQQKISLESILFRDF